MSRVRPELGPPLTTVLRDRFGLPERRSRALIAGVLALLALGGLALSLSSGEDLTRYTHRPAPQFTLLYDGAVFARARPAAGELVRLQAGRGDVRAAVTVRAMTLPPAPGAPIYSVAPIVQARRLDGLRRRAGDLAVRHDGRTRVNGAPGYEIDVRTGPRGRHAFLREVLLVEDEEARTGVLIRLRYTTQGRLTKAEREFVKRARSAYRSFRFGTERP